MRRTAWPLRPLPEGRGEVWRWHLTSLAELPGARSDLRELLASDRPGGTASAGDELDDPAAEQVVLAFDELASNALRHGEGCVVATVLAGTGGWLLDVSDEATGVEPAPAVDRDPAKGGLGLHLVARLSLAHGWYSDDLAKHVWACMPSRAGAPVAQAAPVTQATTRLTAPRP